MSFPMSLIEEAPVLGSDSEPEIPGSMEQEQRTLLRGSFSESTRTRFLLAGIVLGCLGLAVAVVSTSALPGDPGLTPARSSRVEGKNAEPGASPFGSSPFGSSSSGSSPFGGSSGIQTSSSFSSDGDAAQSPLSDPFGSQSMPMQKPEAHFDHSDAMAAVKAMQQMEDLMKGSFFSTTGLVTMTPLPTAAAPGSQLSQQYCNPNEELYDNKCYKSCNVLTHGDYPIRTTAYSCCQKQPCAGVSKMGGLPIPCTGFDINANGECPKEVMAVAPPPQQMPQQPPAQQPPAQQPPAQQPPAQQPPAQQPPAQQPAAQQNPQKTPGFLPPQFPTS